MDKQKKAGLPTGNGKIPAAIGQVITLTGKTLARGNHYILLMLFCLTLVAMWIPWERVSQFTVSYSCNDTAKRDGELDFPPSGSVVPRTVELKGHARNIAHNEDLRVEVKNDAGQVWYKKMSFAADDEIIRPDHHFGLIEKDVGKVFYVQLVVPKTGIHLNEDVYSKAQPVERLGKQIRYKRRACVPGEKLTPDTWHAQMLALAEVD